VIDHQTSSRHPPTIPASSFRCLETPYSDVLRDHNPGTYGSADRTEWAQLRR
jgi:hypothetical protein